MRRRSLLGLLVAAVAAAAWLLGLGDGGGAASTKPAPLTPPELRWIRGYARWAIEVEEAEPGRAGRRSLADCAAVLRSTAGRVPSRRLEEAAALVEDACSSLTGGQTDEIVESDLARADELLSPFLLSASRLPETNEATLDSRRSTMLGAIAGAHVRAEVEVLCWSDRDWRRMIREENAWSDTDEDPEAIDGVAFVEEGRMHLLLGDCNLLGRLRDERLADRSREGLLDAADAVAIFSHEIQHFVLPDADEAEVECAGSAALARVGRALGLDGGENDLLAEIYAESIRPDLPDEYRMSCGGS